MEMKILNKYMNGNVAITLFSDGTKVMECKGKQQIDFPTSIDIKITNWCDMFNICKWCLTKDTSITTLNGEVAISELRSGDLVLSKNNDLQEWKEVYHLYERPVEEDIYHIELENGNALKITGNHKVYTNRGLIQASMLTEEDELIGVYDESNLRAL